MGVENFRAFLAPAECRRHGKSCYGQRGFGIAADRPGPRRVVKPPCRRGRSRGPHHGPGFHPHTQTLIWRAACAQATWPFFQPQPCWPTALGPRPSRLIAHRGPVTGYTIFSAGYPAGGSNTDANAPSP